MKLWIWIVIIIAIAVAAFFIGRATKKAVTAEVATKAVADAAAETVLKKEALGIKPGIDQNASRKG
jgi:uncharacterized protein (UPF0333 family)